VGYGLDDRGSRVRFPAGTGNFSLHHGVQNGSAPPPPPQPPIQWVPGSVPMGVKLPAREADCPPTYSAEVKECVEL
jgi:alkanesulfonate monooxygenase SsuD/methylene tetrahydromethanopterin reductase-like flavin-dependent oxidoreductase (luciferase family)